MTRPQSYTRAASLAPTSYDAETRTLEVSWGEGSPATKRDMQGLFIERLDMRGADLSRMTGAPVFLDHVQSTRAQIGVVQKAWVKDGRGFASIKLSSREEFAGYVRDIADGIIRNVSIGYAVSRWTDSTDSQGRRVRTAASFTPFEISFVGVAADPAAKVRSQNMDPELEDTPEQPAQVQQPANELATRNSAIRTLCRSNSMTREFEDSLIDGEGDLIAARAAVNAEMAKRSPAIRTARVGFSNEDPAVIVERRAAAIYARGAGIAPEESAREFYHDSIIDNARWALQVRNQQHRGVSPVEVLTRAMHTTSDFPLILENVLNKSLEAPYQVNRSPIVTKLARQKTLSTFHPASILRVGEIGPLVDLSESGEFAHTTRGEEKNTLALQSGGRRIDYSGKLLVQDDVGALVDAPAQFSLAATAWENSKVLALFADNPTLGDGKEWFDATRTPANLDASNTPISIEALSQAKLAMRKTTGLDGVTILDIAPAFLVVSAELEDRAIQFMSQYNASFWSETNPHKLEILVDPRLPEFEWYVFASPARAPTIDVATLAGQSAPRVTSRENWDNWGISFRCLHHFGCAAVSARGAYKFASGEDSNSEI
jgi:hypothetical protein